MRYFIFFLLFSLTVFGQTTSNKRLALVIGNGNYEKGELKNPVKDATLIAKTLDSLNFDVILRTNLETDRDLKLAIREFGIKRSEYDVAFVYYAGHGIQVGNENYLLPTKEDFLSEDDVLEFAVSVQTIMKYLRGSGNKVNIMILDACRDNPFESSWNRTRSLKGKGLAKIPPPTGSLIAFSTDAGNVAPDGEGENSIYTTSLSRNMLLVDTSIDQVFRNVRAEVLEASDGLQRPVEATQLTGDVFYLNPSNYTDALVQIERIMEQENELEYQKSILVVENILSKYPNNTQANFLKGRLLFRLNYYDQAIAHYQKLVAQFGANVDYYLELFKNYYWKEEYEEAETQLENAIALDSKSAKSYWTRGSLYEDKEKYDKALEDYNTAIILDSTNLSYWYARAQLFSYILEDPKSALQDYFKISTLDKDSTFAKNQYLYSDIGGIYEYDIKDLQKAVAYYTKEIEISPEFSLGFRNRAHVYQKLRQNDKALEDYTEAIRLNPEEAKNFQMRADFFYEQTKYSEALEDYNQAIALEENNMELLYARALLYQNGLNDYENALKDYFRITSIDHDNSFAKNNYLNNNIGVIYQYEFRDLEKALVYYTKEIELSPEYSLGYRNRALIYQELEHDDKALEDYTEAIRVNPKEAINHQQRAEFFNDRKKYRKALEDYNLATSLDSTNLSYLYARAELFSYQLEEPKRALQDFIKISELDKDNSFAKNQYLYNGIGEIYEYDIKDLQKAVAYYTKEIEISPEFSLGFRNRAHVYQKLKQNDKALEDYTEAIRLNPKEAINFQMRADFFYEQTKYQEALEDYNQAIALEENNMELLYARALLYHNDLNDYENALKDYFKITRIDQDNSFAKNEYLNNNIGVIYQYEFRDLEKALVYYTKEIELSPEYSLGYRNRADVYHELEQDDKAITDYSRAISLTPNDSENYVAIGNYYWQKEMYENALKNYTTAIEIDPNNADYLENKAMIFAELNQYEKAVSIYEKIIEKLTEENWIESYYLQKISELYQKIGDYESALKFIEQSLSVYGEDEDIAIDVLSEIYITRGTIYMNTQKMEQAKADYLKAISLIPEDRNPYFNLVNFYIKNNDPSSALVTIDKTIAMDYNDPDGFYKKAKVYFNDKQYINSLISISNAILKSEENDRLVKRDYYIQDLDNLGQISLADLYLFRSKVLMKLEHGQKACEDLYNALLKKTTQNEADTIQTMIQKNCLQ